MESKKQTPSMFALGVEIQIACLIESFAFTLIHRDCLAISIPRQCEVID